MTFQDHSVKNVIIEDIPSPPIEGEEIVTDAELEETFQSTPTLPPTPQRLGLPQQLMIQMDMLDR